MNDQQRKTLQILHDMAGQDQWNSCRESVGKLLPDVAQEDEIRIVLKQIIRFLSDFLNVHPQEEEIRKFIDALNHPKSLEAVSEQLQAIHAWMEKYWDDPGVSNFRNALKRLWGIHQFDKRSDEYLEDMVELLSGILIAIPTQNWGHQNLELWHRWFYQKEKKDAFILAKYEWSDPKTIELRKSLWTEIARDIELAL